MQRFKVALHSLIFTEPFIEDKQLQISIGGKGQGVGWRLLKEMQEIMISVHQVELWESVVNRVKIVRNCYRTLQFMVSQEVLSFLNAI